MGILAIVKEALRIGRTHKSLWLFGLAVAVGAGGGGGGGGQPGGGAAGAPPDPVVVLVLLLVVAVLLIGFVIFKYVSTGALIEGVRRASRDETMTVREGFREGWAHWGVLLRIALIFFAANAVTVALLAAVATAAGRLFGPAGLVVAGGLAALIGVPVLVTLHVWQAFAERIAVFENRYAIDAIGKARLFLHGRLRVGLKLVVAALLAVLAVIGAGLVVLVPVGLLAAAAFAVGGTGLAIAVCVLTLAPVGLLVIALIGVAMSSVWTIGYLTEMPE